MASYSLPHWESHHFSEAQPRLTSVRSHLPRLPFSPSLEGESASLSKYVSDITFNSLHPQDRGFFSVLPRTLLICFHCLFLQCSYPLPLNCKQTKTEIIILFPIVHWMQVAFELSNGISSHSWYLVFIEQVNEK